MEQENNTGAKRGLLSRVFASVPPENRRDFEQHRLNTNVDRMYILAIYIIAVQLILNVINIIKPADSKGSDIMVYVTLSMATLALGVVFWILLGQVRRGRIKSNIVKRILVNGLLYSYLIIQLIFCTLNIISTGGINSYIIAILIVGMFPILRPVSSILTILASFAYTLLAMYLTRDISDTWSSILITDIWTNLIIITGLVVCISVFIYDIYVSNYMHSVRLEQSNAELVRANNRLALMANTDEMTGVSNRHALSQDFGQVWQASALKNTKLAVAIVDIDFFKSYNDKYGHLEGDKCLQKVARSLRKSFRRRSDIVYRYGGEEFLIVYDASSDDAFDLIEAARKNVEQLKIPHGDTSISPYVTISAGVCVVAPSVHVTTDEALKIADDALYESKNNGRNRTTLREFDGI